MTLSGVRKNVFAFGLQLCVLAFTLAHCNARRSTLFLRGESTKEVVVTKHLDLFSAEIDEVPTNTEPNGVGSPFTIPPYDSLPPVYWPDQYAPPVCIDSPIMPLPPPSSSNPTPTLPFQNPPSGPDTGSSPSNPSTGSNPSNPGTGSNPSNPGTGSNPSNPGSTGSNPSNPGTGSNPSDPGTGSNPSDPGFGSNPSDPGSGSNPSDPGSGSNPSNPGTGSNPSNPGSGSNPSNPGSGSNPSNPGTGSGPSPDVNPPIVFPSPPTLTPSPTSPVLSPPYNYEPSPPTIIIPSPPSNNPPPSIFVPSPPVFQPPVVYPPPAVPPPPKAAHNGALWCVAKPTVPDPIIEEAMNYACGSGGDCGSIQPNGLCFQPDTLYAHSSFAFNSYWQRTKVAGGTCDFGGTAMLVTVDPSYDGCHFVLF